jgi:hypothetical protein
LCQRLTCQTDRHLPPPPHSLPHLFHAPRLLLPLAELSTHEDACICQHARIKAQRLCDVQRVAGARCAPLQGVGGLQRARVERERHVDIPTMCVAWYVRWRCVVGVLSGLGQARQGAAKPDNRVA